VGRKSVIAGFVSFMYGKCFTVLRSFLLIFGIWFVGWNNGGWIHWTLDVAASQKEKSIEYVRINKLYPNHGVMILSLDRLDVED
jgi:hypothetical protein